MTNNERLFNGFEKAYAGGKALSVVTKTDVPFGKLSFRDKGKAWVKKLFADVVVSGVIPAGTKLVLRVGVNGIKGSNVYAHSFGWINVPNGDLTSIFEFKGKSDGLFTVDFNTLTNIDKIAAFKETFADAFDGLVLTKTDKMILAYIDDQDLAEVEKTIKCDSTLKYKIKNHAETFAKSLVSRLYTKYTMTAIEEAIV